MPFWSGETLRARLPTLISPYDPNNVDAAAYLLRIGAEIYVSPREGEDPASRTKQQLKPGEAFTIPAGQFAFLVTEETVTVPDDSLAFISIRARIKFRGLINISGFHVDPGYTGQLLFSVFNASPAPIHLERGQPCFLIWYCALDQKSSEVRLGSGYSGVPVDLINPIAGEIHSLAGLAKKITDTEGRLSERVHVVEREHMYIRTGLALVLILLGGIAVRVCSPLQEDRRSASPALSAPTPLQSPSSASSPSVLAPPPAAAQQPTVSPATQADAPIRGRSQSPPR